MKILSEFGNSVDLTYIKAFSEVKINGKEIKVDNNKMINLIDKLFHTTAFLCQERFLILSLSVKF